MMASSYGPPLYAAIAWWFGTGAVLYLVCLSQHHNVWRVSGATALFLGSLYGLAVSSTDVSVGGAYVAFTAVILLWGAQEIAFLAGWITGPRPMPLPSGCVGWPRFIFALRAVLYHELALLASGALIIVLTWDAPNQVALWTFATLFFLRQSAKLNLFLGVPVLNDELMPSSTAFLKSYFAQRPVSAFFPVSVTLSIAALVWLVLRSADPGATAFGYAGIALVATLMALGILEHWFMVVPLPVFVLWRWGTHGDLTITREALHAPSEAFESKETRRMVEYVDSHAEPLNVSEVSDLTPGADRATNADVHPSPRQRLEERFRQNFLEQKAQSSLAKARGGICADPVTTANGGRSI